MHVVLSALAGFLAGPFIHHVAVQAGADQPFGPDAAVCRNCGAGIGLVSACSSCGLSPWRVWVTAALSSLLAGLAAWSLGAVWVLGAYLFYVGMSVALFITDIDHKRIPNRITYPGTPLGVLLLALGALADGVVSWMPRALGGAAVYTLLFGLVYVIARGGFGFGDVKLAVSLGLFAAFLGWNRLFLAGMATAAVGGVVALAAVVGGRAGAKTEIPYGPPMILGTWIAIIWGPQLLTYLM